MAEKPVYICSHIFEDTKPVLLVCREEGDLQFLCGGEHEEDELPRVVGVNHLIERDPTLIEILDIEEGWEAERSDVGGKWIKNKI